VAEDEETLQETEGFSFWGIVERLVREQSNETTIAISLFSKKTCFKIAPSEETTPYAVKVISSKYPEVMTSCTLLRSTCYATCIHFIWIMGKMERNKVLFNWA